MKNVTKLVLVVLVAVMMVGTVSAQTTTTEIEKGTVVHVYGNNLVVRGQDGIVKEYDVQEGFQFTVNGKTVGIEDLTPGTELTAAVTTTTTPHVVETTTVKNAKVLRVVGNTVIARMEDGTIKKFTEIPDDVTLTVDGQPVELGQLREGMNLTATIVSTSVSTVTEREVEVAGAKAHAKPMPKPMAKPVQKVAAPVAETLPSTGSLLPTAGLAGLVMLFAAFSLAVIRRF